MTNNYLEDSQDKASDNWDVFQSLFLEQNSTPAENSTVNNPPTLDNWDTLQTLFQLTPPQLDPPQPLTNSPFPQPNPIPTTFLSILRSQPTPLQRKFSNNSPISTLPLSTLQTQSSNNQFIPALCPSILLSESTPFQPKFDNNQHILGSSLSQPNLLQPSVNITVPLTETRQSPNTPTIQEPDRCYLLHRRLGNILNFFWKNRVQTLVAVSILCPYAVLLPYVVLLAEQTKQQDRKEAQTPNSSPSNVVIYLAPADDSDRNENPQVSSFKPLSLPLDQTKSGDTIKLAVGSETTNRTNISLSLPQGATIVVQPSASKDKTGGNAVVVCGANCNYTP